MQCTSYSQYVTRLDIVISDMGAGYVLSGSQSHEMLSDMDAGYVLSASEQSFRIYAARLADRLHVICIMLADRLHASRIVVSLYEYWFALCRRSTGLVSNHPLRVAFCHVSYTIEYSYSFPVTCHACCYLPFYSRLEHTILQISSADAHYRGC